MEKVTFTLVFILWATLGMLAQGGGGYYSSSHQNNNTYQNQNTGDQAQYGSNTNSNSYNGVGHRPNYTGNTPNYNGVGNRPNYTGNTPNYNGVGNRPNYTGNTPNYNGVGNRPNYTGNTPNYNGHGNHHHSNNCNNNNNSGGHHHNQGHHNNQHACSHGHSCTFGCTNNHYVHVPVHVTAFSGWLHSLAHQSNSAARMGMALDYVEHNWLTTHQIYDILGLFSNESTKLMIAQNAYSNTCDPQNYHYLYRCFSNSACVMSLQNLGHHH